MSLCRFLNCYHTTVFEHGYCILSNRGEPTSTVRSLVDMPHQSKAVEYLIATASQVCAHLLTGVLMLKMYVFYLFLLLLYVYYDTDSVHARRECFVQ